MSKVNIAEMRQNYEVNQLNEKFVSQNPIIQFENWFADAVNSSIKEANAMILSTISDNKPKSRVVLLKEVNAAGFVFFSNYESDKGQQILKNNEASLTFFWDLLERQIRIEGLITKISAEDSDTYYHSRPRASQIGAWVSEQSKKVESREILDAKLDFYNEKFKNMETIPRPDHWGGYILKPAYIEFWQGRPNRLHDRLAYSKTELGWEINRLNP